MGAYHNALREEGSREDLLAALEKAWDETERFRKAATDAAAHLIAAVSLLEGGGKDAAPSDRMFDQMLSDYRASIERTRKALKES